MYLECSWNSKEASVPVAKSRGEGRVSYEELLQSVNPGEL